MSKLDDAMADAVIADAEGNLYTNRNILKRNIEDMMLEIIDEAHQATTKSNTMPLISSYKAIDDMKKYVRQKVEEL